MLAALFNNELRNDGWNLQTMELLGDEEKYRVGPWNPAYGRLQVHCKSRL
jgi:hypothetical protein